MQKQYDAIVAQNKSLQSELRLANKMIDKLTRELAVEQLTDYVGRYKGEDDEYSYDDIIEREIEIYKEIKQYAIKELGE